VVTLLEHPVSSSVEKVKIALREKGIAFTGQIPPDLGSGRGGGEEWMVKSGGIDIILAGLRDKTHSWRSGAHSPYASTTYSRAIASSSAA